MLIFELLDDHIEALKERDGEVADLCQKVKKLNAAEKASTEEISQLQANLDHEAVVHSHREEEQKQLKGS